MKHALVTGGTSGIGHGAAAALSEAGWRVTATGLTDREVGAAAPLANVSFARLDVTDDAGARALVASLPRIDGLVNAAGMIQRGGKEFEVDAFRQTLEVNLVGAMRMCVLCQPKLGETKGAIVNIASMYAFFGAALTPGYAASKGGVGQLTRSLAAAWAKDGVRVNAVAPGWIETPLTEAVRADPARSGAIVSRTPMGRWGSPAEVGAAIRYLLSPDAGFVTGAVLPVDGGYLVA